MTEATSPNGEGTDLTGGAKWPMAEARLVPAALLTATFLLVRDWIVAPPTDGRQIAAYTLFAVTIPLYSLAFAVTWLHYGEMEMDDIPDRFYAAPILGGVLATALGLALSFWFASWTVAAAFFISAVVVFGSWFVWLPTDPEETTTDRAVSDVAESRAEGKPTRVRRSRNRRKSS